MWICAKPRWAFQYMKLHTSWENCLSSWMWQRMLESQYTRPGLSRCSAGLPESPYALPFTCHLSKFCPLYFQIHKIKKKKNLCSQKRYFVWYKYANPAFILNFLCPLQPIMFTCVLNFIYLFHTLVNYFHHIYALVIFYFPHHLRVDWTQLNGLSAPHGQVKTF